MIKKLLNPKNTSLIIEVLSVLAVLFFALIVISNNKFDFTFYHGGDVYRGFQRGVDVWAGVNSYETFNTSNMLTQEKVPGFFPLYFYFMALMVWLSDFSFIKFIDVMRFYIFIFYSLTGVLIYLYLRRFGKMLAVLGIIIYMFNRWTVFDVISLKQESYVLLLFLISMLTFEKNKYISYLLLGFATGIKHLTILITPILFLDFYLNVIKNKSAKFFSYQRFYKYLVLFILFLSPIVIPSLFYFQQNPEKFANAIYFNATRQPESEVASDYIIGLDRVLVLYNQDYSNNFLLMLPRLPMLIVLLMVNYLLFKYKLNRWIYSFLSYLTFVSFNPVLFGQYMVWFFLFIPFIMVSFLREDEIVN